MRIVQYSLHYASKHIQILIAKMSRNQDMVMITPASFLENFEGEVFFLNYQIILEFWNQQVSR